MTPQQIEQLLATALIARLLGWAGAVLATVGVTVKFDAGAPAQIAAVVIGLLGMLIHSLMSRRNLVKAINAPSPPVQTITTAPPQK